MARLQVVPTNMRAVVELAPGNLVPGHIYEIVYPEARRGLYVMATEWVGCRPAETVYAVLLTSGVPVTNPDWRFHEAAEITLTLENSNA